MFEIFGAPPPPAEADEIDDLDRPDSSSTPELPNTHPRGFPTIHLSKSFDLSVSFLRSLLVEVHAETLLQTTVATFVTVVVIPDWGGG